MKKTFIVLVVGLLSTFVPCLMAQTYNEYYLAAKTQFEQGNYDKVENLLNISGISDNRLLNDTKSCIHLLNTANSAIQEKNYQLAISYYQQIIQYYNPRDPQVNKKIEALKQLSNQGYVELPTLGIAVQNKNASIEEVTLQQARTLAKSSRIGNFNDWRLPTRTELFYLNEYKNVIHQSMYQQYKESVPARFGGGRYWTSEFSKRQTYKDKKRSTIWEQWTVYIPFADGEVNYYSMMYQASHYNSTPFASGDAYVILVRTLAPK